MISLKTEKDLEIMRQGGALLKTVFFDVEREIGVGMNAYQLDQLIHSLILKHGCQPAFLGYQGYKYASCISKNEEVVHGIPYPEKIFLYGDIVSVDIGLIYKGFYLDAARTFPISEVQASVKELIEVTKNSFFESIKFAKPGYRLGDMGHALQTYVESYGLSVVRDLYSHGVGYDLHEDPLIPNYGKKGTGIKIKKGMTLAIEPMVNMGDFRVLTLPDKWTIITSDRQWSAHYENTIFVTENGPEVLTA